MAEITACKENMSEQKADGSPAKKKIRTLDDAPNESHEKKGAAQLAKEKRDQEINNRTNRIRMTVMKRVSKRASKNIANMLK